MLNNMQGPGYGKLAAPPLLGRIQDSVKGGSRGGS